MAWPGDGKLKVTYILLNCIFYTNVIYHLCVSYYYYVLVNIPLYTHNIKITYLYNIHGSMERQEIHNFRTYSITTY